MSKLQNTSSKEICSIIEKQGYIFVRQKGSHLVFKNKENKIMVIPNHKILKIGTIHQILKALKISKEDLKKL
jgi:predicted RNA binding protein YcfA (HicA-like mRNA interferase family)